MVRYPTQTHIHEVVEVRRGEERENRDCISKRLLRIFKTPNPIRPKLLPLIPLPPVPGINGNNLPTNSNIPIHRKRQPTRRRDIQHLLIPLPSPKRTSRRLRNRSRVQTPSNDLRLPTYTQHLHRVPRASNKVSIAYRIKREIVKIIRRCEHPRNDRRIPRRRAIRVDRHAPEDPSRGVGEVQVPIADVQAVDPRVAEDGDADGGGEGIADGDCVGAGLDVEGVDVADADVADEDEGGGSREAGYPVQERRACDRGDFGDRGRGGEGVVLVREEDVPHIDAPHGPGACGGTGGEAVVACDDCELVVCNFNNACQTGRVGEALDEDGRLR